MRLKQVVERISSIEKKKNKHKKEPVLIKHYAPNMCLPLTLT